MKKDKKNEEFRKGYFKNADHKALKEKAKQEIEKTGDKSLQKNNDDIKRKRFYDNTYILAECIELIVNKNYTDRMLRQHLRVNYNLVRPGNFVKQSRDYVSSVMINKNFIQSHILKYLNLFDMALEQNKINECRNILNDISEIIGLKNNQNVLQVVNNIMGDNTLQQYNNNDEGVKINLLLDTDDDVEEIEDIKVITGETHI